MTQIFLLTDPTEAATTCFFLSAPRLFLRSTAKRSQHPQARYLSIRCVPLNVFENDWVHFDFDDAGEEEEFLKMGIPLETPITMPLEFLSYCVKSIAYERYSDNICRSESSELFMRLMFIKVREKTLNSISGRRSTQFELISTVRNKIYSRPYEQRSVDSTAHEVRMSRSAFQQALRHDLYRRPCKEQSKLC